MRNEVYSDYAFIPYYGWSINIYIYLYILNQPEFSKKEAVVPERNLPRIMLFVMNVFKRIVRSFLFVISSLDLMAVLSPTSCLTTAFLKTLSFCVFSVYAY